MYGIENWKIQMGLAAFTGGNTADHLSAIGDRLFGMKRALTAGKSLTDDFGIFVDEDCHDLSFHRFDDFFCGIA
jgi:hypothetical protein